MADLKPIGSEKLKGQEKINRILEIARYKENTPSSLNETSRVEFERVLADGNQYEIVKEKSGYVIKKNVNESLDYIEPMRNRKFYSSYAQALKRLNIIASEVNRITENEEEISMFNIGEQKKFTLKTPKPPMAPEPAAALPPPAPAPEEGSMDAPLDDASMDIPAGEDMDMSMDVDTPEGDMDMNMDSEESPEGNEEEVTFKTIQKLTGKLGQKIRMMNDSMGMTSEDVKYVINSMLSALDLSKLDEEDQEDIMAKFEEDTEESSYDDDMGMGDIGGDDEEEMNFDMDVEEPEDGEMSEENDMYLGIGDRGFYDSNDREYTGDFDFDYDEEEIDTYDDLMSKYGNKQRFFAPERSDANYQGRKSDGRRMFDAYREKYGEPFKLRTRRSSEMSEMDPHHSGISTMMDEIFAESKVDKVLSSYFVINEGEKKVKSNKITEKKLMKESTMSKVRKMAETVEQELASEFILKENEKFKFVGKTNKSNLVFEHNGEQIRVSPKGEVL